MICIAQMLCIKCSFFPLQFLTNLVLSNNLNLIFLTKVILSNMVTEKIIKMQKNKFFLKMIVIVHAFYIKKFSYKIGFIGKFKILFLVKI